MFKSLMLLSCLYLVGCASQTAVLSPEARTTHAATLAKKAGWDEQIVQTSLFTLMAYVPRLHKKTKILTIYIEGDGLAWLSEDTPSDNPTPIIPMALKMAIQDRKHNPIVYLARPCQFVSNNRWGKCHRKYWTHLRFSPEVIHAMNQAITHLKNQYHAKRIRLVGYSGGGTIAALISVRRNDVLQLITVAAVLDTEEWVRHGSLTPLQGSLNPADAWKYLMDIPQTHWVGGKDSIVPKENALSFIKRFPETKKPKIKVVPTFDHACCWATDWSALGQ